MIDGRIRTRTGHLIKPLTKCSKFKDEKYHNIILKKQYLSSSEEEKESIQKGSLILYNSKGKIVIHNFETHGKARYV